MFIRLDHFISSSSWERGKSFDICVRECLDRFISSSSLLSSYPNTIAKHLMCHKYDHSLIFIRPHSYNSRRKKKRGFRFEICWLLDENFESIVRGSWEGSAKENITSGLALIGHRLISWSRESFNKLE